MLVRHIHIREHNEIISKLSLHYLMVHSILFNIASPYYLLINMKIEEEAETIFVSFNFSLLFCAYIIRFIVSISFIDKYIHVKFNRTNKQERITKHQFPVYIAFMKYKS